uniref:Uncharacterized protein n=1 Tax=Nelumbo nucifera TaxID=4432 RepID=A0A822ZXL1_NELNU|nr:TPA_asm: hypothetical protein HUJ06_017876 [Nelumbo nucifera]
MQRSRCCLVVVIFGSATEKTIKKITDIERERERERSSLELLRNIIIRTVHQSVEFYFEI